VEHEAHTRSRQCQAPHTTAGMVALQVICAWCQQHMIWHQVLPPIPFPISYSICARCYTDVAREFAPHSLGSASPGLRAS
jgi:hypothetical protein